jgi:protein-S-isoprenylcysteine O-methyltransferase Ste14
MMTRPSTASGPLVGVGGILGGAAAAFAVHGWQTAPHTKTLVVAIAAATAMVVLDALSRQPGAAPLWLRAPIRPGSIARTSQKFLALWGVVAMLAAAYLILPEYATGYYDHAKQAFVQILPLLLVGSAAYIYFVDRRQDDPDDHYLRLAKAVGNPKSLALLDKDFALGWVVKGFFLPLMFTFLTLDLQTYWSGPQVPTFADFVALYEFAYGFLFMCDVLLAGIGYAFALRLLDTHIRTVEPTVLGWVACLICYPPFWQHLSARFFAYESDGYYWGDLFWGQPVLYLIWGCAIIAVLFVYVWATGAFGLRFSNLTNRGIITGGPYRWLKHPAYVAKNLSYWMISLPFLTTGSWVVAVQASALLLGVNLIYVVRAVTEERHLARDPVYRQYQQFIAEDGLWARLKRLGRRRRAALSSVPSMVE